MATKKSTSKSTETKKDPDTKPRTEAKSEEKAPQTEAAVPQPEPTQKFVFDDTAANAAQDALQGHFVTVDGGDHKGTYGVFESVLNFDKDGVPQTCIVRSRDNDNAPFSVEYKHLRPAESGGR